jgi:hypothetical protein
MHSIVTLVSAPRMGHFTYPLISPQIARNRLGLNDTVHEKAKKEADAEKAKKAKEGGEKKRKKT